MAIDIITGFNSASRESLDKRSGPYASLADAKAALDTNERYVGLRVSVISNSSIDGAGNYTGGDLTEYVFDGGITDNDLVEVITLKSDLTDHINDTNNPHSVTAAQLNLDNVDNTSDANKPISTATQNALDTKPSSSDFDNIVKLTQAEYDAIATPDPNTLYIITI
jgi:hypothetical protein